MGARRAAPRMLVSQLLSLHLPVHLLASSWVGWGHGGAATEHVTVFIY